MKLQEDKLNLHSYYLLYSAFSQKKQIIRNMNVLAWVIFGLIVGIISNMVTAKESSSGVLATITLGIVGALVGGFLGNILFGAEVARFNLSSFAIAAFGSVLISFVAKTLSQSAKHSHKVNK